MEFNYFNVNKDVIAGGLRELAKDYLNSAMKLIETNQGPREVVEDIMTKYFSITLLARQRNVSVLEDMDDVADEINKWVERK